MKNDFYGHNEPGSSKRVYYPVKQEKLNMAQLTKRMKVDEDDIEARAKEVREMLQGIMGLTYKVGNKRSLVAFMSSLSFLLYSYIFSKGSKIVLGKSLDLSFCTSFENCCAKVFQFLQDKKAHMFILYSCPLFFSFEQE